MAALAPALASAETAPAVQCDASAVLTASYRQGGATWVLAVNTGREPVESKLTLAGEAAQAEAVFEGRSVKAQGGAWSDSFGPYERHVYKLTR